MRLSCGRYVKKLPPCEGGASAHRRPWWIDSALLADAGIPTVIFGPGGEGAHATVEWVNLDEVEQCAPRSSPRLAYSARDACLIPLAVLCRRGRGNRASARRTLSGFGAARTNASKSCWLAGSV